MFLEEEKDPEYIEKVEEEAQLAAPQVIHMSLLWKYCSPNSLDLP